MTAATARQTNNDQATAGNSKPQTIKRGLRPKQPNHGEVRTNPLNLSVGTRTTHNGSNDRKPNKEARKAKDGNGEVDDAPNKQRTDTITTTSATKMTATATECDRWGIISQEAPLKKRTKVRCKKKWLDPVGGESIKYEPANGPAQAEECRRTQRTTDVAIRQSPNTR